MKIPLTIPPETLETERMMLKKITPEYFAFLFRHASQQEIMDLLGLDNEAEFIQEKEKSDGGYTTYDRSILTFVMVLKSNGLTIGRCGFHNWYAYHKKAEIGYRIHRDEHKGKGYMSEALKTIIPYGFNTMGLNRIEACTSPTNAASLHLLKKFGFTQEGYLRQHFVRDTGIEDSMIFSLLCSEF